MPSHNTYHLTWVTYVLLTYLSNPMSEEQQLRGHRRAKRSFSMFKVRRGGREEIPLIHGKEQRLHFAGAAVKRYPTFKVRQKVITFYQMFL